MTVRIRPSAPKVRLPGVALAKTGLPSVPIDIKTKPCCNGHPMSSPTERLLNEKKLKRLVNQGRVPIVFIQTPDGSGFAVIPPPGTTSGSTLESAALYSAVFNSCSGNKSVPIITIPKSVAEGIRAKVQSLLPTESTG